jgi:hypothetical protein
VRDEFARVTEPKTLVVHGGIKVAQAFERGRVGHVGARCFGGARRGGDQEARGEGVPCEEAGEGGASGTGADDEVGGCDRDGWGGWVAGCGGEKMRG